MVCSTLAFALFYHCLVLKIGALDATGKITWPKDGFDGVIAGVPKKAAFAVEWG